jgi:protein-L-isoaspartate(D-aspartate) O-methyltransferase
MFLCRKSSYLFPIRKPDTLFVMADYLEIQRQELIRSLYKAGIHDKHVLDAIASIPRERFVDELYYESAYEDRALPIDMGQTISQPFVVAIMTQALQLTGQERVLEIGTGSGYQTAILARLAAYVYSVERHQRLACQAAGHLLDTAIQNVSIYVGDGSLGWPDQAPYDRILVTAAAPSLPSQFVAQLNIGGLLIIPIGGQERQELLVVQRVPRGTRSYSLGACVFVPLVGQEGWHEEE